MLSLYVKYQALSNALEMSQNTKQFASLFSNELKCYYKFLINDILLNIWEEKWIVIHI
jgi:hypothetical protein